MLCVENQGTEIIKYQGCFIIQVSRNSRNFPHQAKDKWNCLSSIKQDKSCWRGSSCQQAELLSLLIHPSDVTNLFLLIKQTSHTGRIASSSSRWRLRSITCWRCLELSSHSIYLKGRTLLICFEAEISIQPFHLISFTSRQEAGNLIRIPGDYSRNTRKQTYFG